jgi:hypothetical protein
MKSTSRSVLALTCLALACAAAESGEKKIQRRNLPPAVEQAVVQASSGARIVGFAQETENGQTFYEMELKVNGRTKDVTFDAQGRTVSLEMEVSMADLPPAISAGLRKAAGKGRIVRVESITKGNVVTYEAGLKGGTQKEVLVDSEGNPLPVS